MVRLLTAQGRLEEARAAAAESVALSPKDDLAWEALGNLEQQLGRTAAAIAAMEQAVAISPQSRRFNDRLKRLRALHGAMAE
jgi:tetratricopeptide (TPR) repeat protein